MEITLYQLPLSCWLVCWLTCLNLDYLLVTFCFLIICLFFDLVNHIMLDAC
jgi:hypothetical protein